MPAIWVLWEWIYLPLEFTMGTHLVAYSQSSNIWLIQFIDLTGVWGLSFWLILFNILIFKAYRAVAYTLKATMLYKKLLPVFSLMLGIPFLYSLWAFSQYGNIQGNQAMEVSLVPTHFLPNYLNNEANGVSIVEQTLHRTDSLAFYRMEAQKFSDLYIWPETGISYQLGTSNLSSFALRGSSRLAGRIAHRLQRD